MSGPTREDLIRAIVATDDAADAPAIADAIQALYAPLVASAKLWMATSGAHAAVIETALEALDDGADLGKAIDRLQATHARLLADFRWLADFEGEPTAGWRRIAEYAVSEEAYQQRVKPWLEDKA